VIPLEQRANQPKSMTQRKLRSFRSVTRNNKIPNRPKPKTRRVIRNRLQMKAFNGASADQFNNSEKKGDDESAPIPVSVSHVLPIPD
jgi:hypothetical protein